MISFKPLPLSPIRLNLSEGRKLGQAVTFNSPAPPIDPTAVKAVVVGAGLVSVAIAGASVWVGHTVAKEKKGWLKAAGWVVGIGGALSGLATLVQMGTVLAASPEKLKNMMEESLGT